MKIPAIHLINVNDRKIKSSDLPFINEALDSNLKYRI